MSVSVAYKDVGQCSLLGVLEMSESELSKNDARVSDLIQVLNKKLGEAKDMLRVVDFIQLYGILVPDHQKLDALIPQVAGGCTRLVANTTLKSDPDVHGLSRQFFSLFNMQSVPRVTGTKMMITVLTLTGKRLPINCMSTSRIGDVKLLIQEQEGIPEDQQRLVFAGERLEENRTLSDYNICTNLNCF